MTYHVPLKDIEFYLKDVHDFVGHYHSLDVSLGEDLFLPILQEGAKFAEQELYPLNKTGDEEGVKLVEGQVLAPAGFKEAYSAYVEGGWPSLGQAEAHGGQELPISLSLVLQEMWHTANQSWGMYASVTEGTATMLTKFGTEEQKQRYLPKLVSGEWIGTMDITEPQAGSDVGQIRTRAEPHVDGSYRITGSKIFITSGDQDMSENVIHFVLARLQDAPPGSRGLSLFIVPKFAVNDDGSLGERNSLGCSSVEHKMGLKGSATCAIYYEGAKGYLLGEANRGLMAMFVLINKSRLGVAVQGYGQAEGAWQMSLSYAQERIQGKSPTGEGKPEGDALVAHPDIQRMLKTQRAFAEGGRALTYEGLKELDLTTLGTKAEAGKAEQKLALMVPILKGCISEWGYEATDLGIQILGGHGYTQDWGVEQRVRDTRITRIYEGTTGIQAQDFLVRKVLPNPDVALDILYGELPEPRQARLNAYISELRAITQQMANTRDSLEKGVLESLAYDYLMFNGYLLLGVQWLKVARIAKTQLDNDLVDKEFGEGKIELAEFYFTSLLPRAGLHLELVKTKLENKPSIF